MTIELILNSYYRSGSTVLFKMLELSNPDKVVLCEPLHPDLFTLLDKYGPYREDPLHQMKLWTGYFKLPRSVLIELRERHMNFTACFDAEPVLRYLDPLHKCEKCVLLKTTRMHFVLGEVKKKLGCKVIHVVRSPALVWMDHLHISIVNDEEAFWRVTLTRHLYNHVSASFYLGPMFKALQERFTLPEPRDNFDRFVACWIISNYHAMQSADVVLVYEILLYRRGEYLDHINAKLGREYFRKEHAHLPNEQLALHHLYRVPMLMKLFEESAEYMGVLNMWFDIEKRIEDELRRWEIRELYYRP